MHDTMRPAHGLMHDAMRLAHRSVYDAMAFAHCVLDLAVGLADQLAGDAMELLTLFDAASADLLRQRDGA